MTARDDTAGAVAGVTPGATALPPATAPSAGGMGAAACGLSAAGAPAEEFADLLVEQPASASAASAVMSRARRRPGVRVVMPVSTPQLACGVPASAQP